MSEIIITLESQEKHYSFEDLGVTFESSNDEILKAVQPVILETTGVNISEDDDQLYTVKKIEESKNVYIFPKSPAGI
jgi:hypothetical protein